MSSYIRGMTTLTTPTTDSRLDRLKYKMLLLLLAQMVSIGSSRRNTFEGEEDSVRAMFYVVYNPISFHFNHNSCCLYH